MDLTCFVIKTYSTIQVQDGKVGIIPCLSNVYKNTHSTGEKGSTKGKKVSYFSFFSVSLFCSGMFCPFPS